MSEKLKELGIEIVPVPPFQVRKKSELPFKSGFRTNTVRGTTINPYTGKPAYVFIEDDTFVECQMCVPGEWKLNP